MKGDLRNDVIVTGAYWADTIAEGLLVAAGVGGRTDDAVGDAPANHAFGEGHIEVLGEQRPDPAASGAVGR